MSKVNNIVEDKAFTFSPNEQVQQVDVKGRLLEARLRTLKELDQEVLSLCNVNEIPQGIGETYFMPGASQQYFSTEWGGAGN